MKSLIEKAGALQRLVRLLKELFNKEVTVHYSSVPLWRPWRDY